MYVWCINSRIDWVAKYLLKTSWNSNTWYAFQESIFDIFPKRNKYYLHLQFTNNLLLHYILAIRVHIWSACMRSFSRSTVRCALRFGLIFFFVCWVSWCFCNIKSICSMNRNSVLLLVSFNSTWQWMKASDQRLKWDPKGGEWVRVRERDRGRTAQGEFDYLRAVASVTNKYISLIFPVQRYTLCMMNCGKPLTKITLKLCGNKSNLAKQIRWVVCKTQWQWSSSKHDRKMGEENRLVNVHKSISMLCVFAWKEDFIFQTNSKVVREYYVFSLLLSVLLN